MLTSCVEWNENPTIRKKNTTALLNAKYIPYPLCLYIILLDLYLNQVKRYSHPSFTDDGTTKLKKSWPHSEVERQSIHAQTQGSEDLIVFAP